MADGTLLALRYAVFAAIATAVNLGTQWLVREFYGGQWSLELAMICGTATGLATKYPLDKIWIFADSSTGVQNHLRKFSLYSLLSVVTTAIFWANEILFAAVSHSDRMGYVGAVVGLTIGYVTKYQLDRRYVFGTVS